MGVLGCVLVLFALGLGARDLAADVMSRFDGTVSRTECGSVFSTFSGSGVRVLLSSPFFAGRQGCEFVLGQSLLAVLLSISVGVLLMAIAVIRHINRSRSQRDGD
jgi:hypothetical protein